jgi:transcriptional regulator with XRE-family HTH domain
MKTTGDIELGRRVKQARENAKLTQEKLAEMADVSLPMIQKIEQGSIFGSRSTHLKLAAALKIRLAYLSYGIEETDEPGEKLLYWLDLDPCLSANTKKILKLIIETEHAELRQR